ncbi:MAG: hypothetical protein KDC98_14515, partial [Planctomycetes bacterium]|nr:hypothetical protein [Planctomycetota bacterium]
MKPGYDHTQRGPLWIILGIGVVAGAVVVPLTEELAARVALCAFTAAFAFLAACFATLTVRDRGQHLTVRFGPLPLWGTRLRYDAVRQVSAARSRLIDGWGIHWMPGRGWTFNLWGFDCVEVRTA